MENYLDGEQALDFDEFANQLLDEGSNQSPAFLHGGICGVYAGGGALEADYCLAAASQALDLGLHGELAENCLRLADVTLRAMQDEEFDFQLFLPDDETEMEQRLQGLADWCSGFLAGYAFTVAVAPNSALSEDTGEVLKDVAAIVEVTLDPDSDEEEAENQYFELTEYLRFASLNLFMEKLSQAAAAEDSPAPGDNGH
ncbi:MAG: UPF0149 family protein [Halieaceae bacterium]